MPQLVRLCRVIQCAFAKSDTCNRECCHFHSGSGYDLFAATEKTPPDGWKHVTRKRLRWTWFLTSRVSETEVTWSNCLERCSGSLRCTLWQRGGSDEWGGHDWESASDASTVSCSGRMERLSVLWTVMFVRLGLEPRGHREWQRILGSDRSMI